MSDRLRRDESGMSMIVVVVLATVMLVLSVTVIATALHSDDASARDSSWNKALAVAEAGVELSFDSAAQAVFDTGVANTSLGGPVPGGEYSASVRKCSGVDQPVKGCGGAGYIVVESLGSVPSATSPVKVQRRLRVTYGPEAVFRYALFGLDDLDLGNQNTVSVLCSNTPNVIGDVFANRKLTLGNNWHVRGSLVTSTGPITVGSNTCISRDTNDFGGSIFSGGSETSGSSRHGVLMGQGSRVQGNIEVRADCTNVPASQYNLTLANSVTVDGYALLPPTGSVNGATTPPRLVSTCKQRYGSVPFPTLPDPTAAGTTFATANGCPTTGANACVHIYTGPSAVSDFLAYMNSHVGTATGYFYVDAGPSTAAIDMRAYTINGDFVLRSKGEITVGGSNPIPFYQGRGHDPTAGDEITVQIISEKGPANANDPACPTPSYGDLILDSNLNFNIQVDPASDLPAVLFVAKGCAKINQVVTVPGALYAKGINGGNNLSVAYNEEIKKTIALGDKKLARDLTLELSPNG